MSGSALTPWPGNERDGVLADPAQRLYVVLDGAPFDDLPGLLSARRVAHRSLFTKTSDLELVRVGPWLADPYTGFDESIHGLSGYALQTLSEASTIKPIDQELIPWHGVPAHPNEQIYEILGAVGDLPAAVFWTGDAALAEHTLWRHLRTINKVRIADRRPGKGEEELEWVIFRHADPNVLAQTLPALDEAQFARFLGPAAAVLFKPEPDYADVPGWQKAGRFEGLPMPGTQPLTLDRDTLDRIEERRALAIGRGIKSYLRDTAANGLWPLSDAEIDAAVRRSEASARELGIKTAENRKKWAWLDIASDGYFSRSPIVREDVARPDTDQDWYLDNLILLTRKELGGG